MFISELKLLKSQALACWLILGDFNLIYLDSDKSNGKVNRRMMLWFRRALNHLEVKEIQLVGRKYTWSNSQPLPTMSEMIEPFVPLLGRTTSVILSYNNCSLQSLTTTLFFWYLSTPPKLNPRFQFESFWIEMVGYKECVKGAWERIVYVSHNSFAMLHIKLSRTAKALKIRVKSIMSQAKMAMIIAREVIAQMDKAQESIILSEGERTLAQTLKVRLLGLVAIEKK